MRQRYVTERAPSGIAASHTRPRHRHLRLWAIGTRNQARGVTQDVLTVFLLNVLDSKAEGILV